MPLRKSTWLLLAGLLAATGGVAAVASSPPGLTSELRRTVSRQPAAFTELYFTSPSSLPRQLPATAPSTFSFTIVSHEKEATTYHYVVSAATAATAQPLAAGDVRLLAGTGTSIPVELVPAVLGVGYVVTVRLADRVESVHFSTHS